MHLVKARLWPLPSQGWAMPPCHPGSGLGHIPFPWRHQARAWPCSLASLWVPLPTLLPLPLPPSWAMLCSLSAEPCQASSPTELHWDWPVPLHMARWCSQCPTRCKIGNTTWIYPMDGLGTANPACWAKGLSTIGVGERWCLIFQLLLQASQSIYVDSHLKTEAPQNILKFSGNAGRQVLWSYYIVFFLSCFPKYLHLPLICESGKLSKIPTELHSLSKLKQTQKTGDLS